MEIDYWTSANVTHARKLNNDQWEVTVRRGDKDRIFKPKHVVFALGIGSGTPNMPKIDGMVRAISVRTLNHRLMSEPCPGHLQGPDLALCSAQQGPRSRRQEGRGRWLLHVW